MLSLFTYSRLHHLRDKVIRIDFGDKGLGIETGLTTLLFFVVNVVDSPLEAPNENFS
jgi:hypothetical protein